MPLLGLVVLRGALLHELSQARRIEGLVHGRQHLDEVEQIASISVGHGEEGLPRLRIQRQCVADRLFGSFDDRRQGGLIEPLEHEHLAAGEQCAVELEARVLGRRPDEHDRPVFDIREEGILLGAVESVDLVDEQQRALSDFAPLLRGEEHLPQIGDSGEGGRQRLEDEIGSFGEEAGDRRLPAPGRPPQHHRGESVFGDHPSDRALRGEQMLLADHLGESRRPQPVGQGARGLIGPEQCGRILTHQLISFPTRWRPDAR